MRSHSKHRAATKKKDAARAAARATKKNQPRRK